MIQDEPTKEGLRTKLIEKSNNSCCICQIPFIHAHHIDLDNKNDIFDNLAPLCPNHHSLAHTKSQMFLNLSPKRIKAIREKWYSYCENRKQNISQVVNRDFGVARLKVKNFVRYAGDFGATYGWKKTFVSLDENYKELNRDQIIDRIFSTSDPDKLKIYLEAMRGMYSNALRKKETQEMFREVCNAFGFDFDGKNVI
jgi:Ca2+-binding EF-hand superfamily protein